MSEITEIFESILYNIKGFLCENYYFILNRLVKFIVVEYS